MSQTTTRTATVLPFPGRTVDTTTTTSTRTAAGLPSPVKSSLRQRIAQLARRRRRPPEAYRPRRVDVEPFEHGSVEWRRMLMSMQRLT